MTPYVPHPEHGEFPVALVCRPPYGPPNHGSASNPQNAAWLSALRHARKNVFIQTPTLNAEPLVPAIAEACERGVDVHCYVCIGYNDAVRCCCSKLFFPLSFLFFPLFIFTFGFSSISSFANIKLVPSIYE